MSESTPAVGEAAPAFTGSVVGEGIEPFDVADHLGVDPVVLAFFPGAFTSVCTAEMRSFEDRLAEFPAEAELFGVAVDSPFALAEFRDQQGLSFELVSDFHREGIAAYGVETAFEEIGLAGIAARAMFVVDPDGVVTYRWVGEDPGREPDYEAVLAAVEAVT